MIGWVEQDEIKLLALECGQKAQRVALEHIRTIFVATFGDVALEHGERLRRLLDENGLLCAAAERLKAESAGAGEHIEHACVACNLHLDDIKEPFFDAIGGWSGIHAGDGFELGAPTFSCDDSHSILLFMINSDRKA